MRLTGSRSPGRPTGADGELVTFADDLGLNLERADDFFDERLRGTIDASIERAGIDAPPDDRVAVLYRPRGLGELDLRRAGVSTIIWATGYALDHGSIDAPILDGMGHPRNARGVSAVPGRSFLGLLWQHSQASASLVGPSLDGPHLVDEMARRSGRGPASLAAGTAGRITRNG